jgi:DNA invertase Pin-like site-specific DNA recombinase
MTVLAAVAQFERTLISERIKDAKRNLRRAGRHQGGRRPFGWNYGEATGAGRARDLVPDDAEQAAIGDIIAMRESGRTLMGIRDIMRARGFKISHQAIANIIGRQSEDLSTAKPAAIKWQPPAGWVDRTAEAVRDGGIMTIVGAPRAGATS